ncbi:aminodeoxychorismate/anthranilate synthase component II [Eubacteriaceae bacterium ES2]|nr:aminodeoxychorismate/anthranilate synthase component II [Eubacteriaceae bacterium ES2]
MILLIDNYDSFSYNLYQYVGMLNPDIRVIRNNEYSVEEIKNLNPDAIIISPGPGKPSDAGVCEDVIDEFKGVCPILGVCLGHQAICEVFGGEIALAKTLMHGKKSNVHISNSSPIFSGLSPIIKGARYHSLAAVRSKLPDELLIIAEDDEGEVMAVKHRSYEIYGIQFHPESILTDDGECIIKNFLELKELKNDQRGNL